MDANKDYLVIGYQSNQELEGPEGWIGHVDVHSRRELDQNGMHQKRLVSSL